MRLEKWWWSGFRAWTSAAGGGCTPQRAVAAPAILALKLNAKVARVIPEGIQHIALYFLATSLNYKTCIKDSLPSYCETLDADSRDVTMVVIHINIVDFRILLVTIACARKWIVFMEWKYWSDLILVRKESRVRPLTMLRCRRPMLMLVQMALGNGTSS